MARKRPDHWRHNRDHFFKYVSGETAKAVLKNHSLKWSLASNFNDPFDMQFDLHLEFDADELVRICKEDSKDILLGRRGFEPSIGLGNVLARLQTLSPKLPASVLDEFLEQAFRTAIDNLPKNMPQMHADLRNHFTKYNVLCLSAVNDSLLMWSHYANSHRGVVIRFACLEETDSSWSIAEPIVYSDMMPRFCNQDDLRGLFTGTVELSRDAIVRRTILSKAVDWSYEQEWRVYNFSQARVDQYLNFNAPELSAIYFGCRSSQEDRQTIMKAARAINSKVEFYIAAKAERAFTLEFKRFD